MLGFACAWLCAATLSPFTFPIPSPGAVRKTFVFQTGPLRKVTPAMARRPRERCVAYVIRNADGAVYVGTTTDFPERLRRHNEGGGHAFTRTHKGPWVVVRIEALRSRNAAMDLEAVWTNHLRASGTLPFIDFPVTAYGPTTHGDHHRRDVARLTRSDCQ